MKKVYITVNCSEIHSKDEFFAAFDAVTPSYFGKNLDALHDVLTELSGEIRIAPFAELEKNLSSYSVCIRRVLDDSVRENPELSVIIE